MIQGEMLEIDWQRLYCANLWRYVSLFGKIVFEIIYFLHSDFDSGDKNQCLIKKKKKHFYHQAGVEIFFSKSTTESLHFRWHWITQSWNFQKSSSA